ncbi:MAG: alpha/beta fold hydrolase [Candidatus Binatia bacterium]
MTWLADVRQVQLPEGTIRYRELGSGQPIVFVHGLLVNGNLWRGVAPPLAARFRCLVPDWPLGSHEMAMSATVDLTPRGIAETIIHFLDALKLDDVTLVGNDTGGAICQIAVAHHPKRFSRLVLTNCDAFDNFLPPRYRYLSWGARVPGFVATLAQTMRLRLTRRLPIAYGPLTERPLPADVSDSYVKALISNAAVRRDVGRILRAISPTYTLEAARRFHEFTNPVLLVWSPGDPIFPFAHAERLAALFPNARIEQIEDSGAFVPEDQPRLLAERIDAFLGAARPGRERGVS